MLEEIAAAADNLAAYDFDLPADRIAQVPSEDRDGARLLILQRSGGSREHAQVRDLPRFLRRGDLLVFNQARVTPARLFGRAASGGAVELLFLRETDDRSWQCLGRPAKRLRAGSRVTLPGGVVAKVAVAAVEGRCEVRIEGRVDVAALLEEYGELPLPPYIKRPDGPTPLDRERYQTVFGRQPGAVAAPTAGLHFTERLLGELCAAGVELAWLTLEVGPATFMPVRSDSLRDHRMEGERADLPPETVEAITAAKREKRRVIGVGTTTARALESRAAQPCGLRPGSFLAESFLRPGVPFRVLDGLMTNFHLPGSTLLMLVSGFAGREQMLDAYAEAVALQYRFYSYGDAMLIV